MAHAISLLSIQYFGKSMGVEHKVLPDGQPPTEAFTMLAQLCGPQAKGTEIDATLLIKNGEERNFDFDF